MSSPHLQMWEQRFKELNNLPKVIVYVSAEPGFEFGPLCLEYILITTYCTDLTKTKPSLA